jgi:PAS domain S-box-containing protein
VTKIERWIEQIWMEQMIAFAHTKPSTLIFDWVRRQLNPPVFADPEKRRQARLTHILIQVSFIVVVLLGSVAFVDHPSPLLFCVYTAIAGLLVVGLVLLRWGFIHFANRLLNMGILCIFTYEAIFLDNDIRSVGYALLYLAVIHAGITLGRRAAFWNTGMIMLLGIALQYAKHWGLLPPVAAMPSDYFRLTAYSGGLTIAASLIYLSTESLQQAIASLQQNEAIQVETNCRLQYEISEWRAHEREQAAVLTMAGAMRKVDAYAEIVPIILAKTLEILGGSAAALSRFTGNSNEQTFEFDQGDWHTWSGRRLTQFPNWEKSTIGNSTIYVNNAVAEDQKFPLAEQMNQVNAVALVLLEGTELQIGGLWLGSQQAITPADLQILAAIGAMVASALQRIQLHAETSNRAKQLAAINRLGQFIAETLDLVEIYTQIDQTTRAVLPEVSDLFIELFNADQNQLELVYLTQNGEAATMGQPVKSSTKLKELDFLEKIEFPPPFTIQTFDAENGQITSAYVLMAARSEIVGVLHVRSKMLRRFSPIDLEFLTLLANTSAIFIQNTLLFKDVQQSNQRAQTELAERKQAEATIRRHLTAMESSIDGIAMLDYEQTFTYVNDAFASLYGYQDPEKMLGQPWQLLYRPEVIQGFEQDLIPELTATGKWRGEASGRRQDGSIFQQELSLVRLETGEITAVVRDITERKDTEAALQRSQKLESLGVLAGGIAHDFNNFLAGLVGQISLARAKLPIENPAYRHVEKAIALATRATGLTRQLLAYTGKGNFQVSAVDVNALIRDNVSLLETVVPKQVQLNFDLSPDVPLIEGDIGQLQQVIMNLIMNAAEAMASAVGCVTIQSKLCIVTEDTNRDNTYIGVDRLAPGPYLVLAVQDNGSGMDKKVIDRIFDPFFSTKGPGRGLGLSATLGIIRSHKGRLQVESQIGVGSTFQVFLPAASNIVSASPPVIETSTEKLEGSVLVIDDEAALRDSLSEIMEMAGLHVLKAVNGQDGVILFQQHHHEILTILLDVHMPVMNGLDALQALKAIDPEVDVILSSGYSEYSIADHLLNQPTVTFLQKPYSMETVLQRVAERIKKKRLSSL